MTDFTGKHYIITGGASGIGLATARRLKNDGAKLTLWDINTDGLHHAGDSLGADTATVDITDAEQVTQAIDDALSAHGRIDGVIHCAGVLHTGTFAETSLEWHHRMLNVNLGGTFTVSHSALPALKQSGGSLILLASVSAFYGPPDFSTYGASKAGVLSFAQALQVELHDTNVHVGVVTPNFVDTPMLNEHNSTSRMVDTSSPLLTLETPNTIAEQIVKNLQTRRFIAFTNWRCYVGYVLSRYFAWLAPFMMKQIWIRSSNRVQ